MTTQFFLGSFGLSVSQQFGLPPNGRTELSEVPESRPNGDLVPVVGDASFLEGRKELFTDIRFFCEGCMSKHLESDY